MRHHVERPDFERDAVDDDGGQLWKLRGEAGTQRFGDQNPAKAVADDTNEVVHRMGGGRKDCLMIMAIAPLAVRTGASLDNPNHGLRL